MTYECSLKCPLGLTYGTALRRTLAQAARMRSARIRAGVCTDGGGGHNYVGHNCIGHSNCTGYNHIAKAQEFARMGVVAGLSFERIDHNYTGHSYMGHNHVAMPQWKCGRLPCWSFE